MIGDPLQQRDTTTREYLYEYIRWRDQMIKTMWWTAILIGLLAAAWIIATSDHSIGAPTA